MKVYTPKEFSKLLKKEKPNRILIVGAESAFIKKTLELIRERWAVPSESVSEFYQHSEDVLTRIADAVMACSLFSSESMVVVRNTGELLRKLSQKERRQLKELVSQVPTSTCLVLVEDEDVSGPEESHTAKLLSDVEIYVVNCRRARPQELKAWLKRRLERYGLDQPEVLETLLSSCGGSVEALEREVEKLAAGGVREALSEGRNYTVWDMVSLALEGDGRALEAFRRLEEIGTPYTVVLAAFQTSLRNLILLDQGLKRFHPFAERRMRGQLERLGLEKVLRLYKRTIALERRLKFSGSSDLAGHHLASLVAEAVLLSGPEEGTH